MTGAIVVTDYIKSYTGNDPHYIEWLDRRRKQDRRELLEIFAVMFVLFFILAAFFFTVWAIEPAEFKAYRCKDRGGIRQALTNRNGYATSYICEDGTQQPTQIQTRGTHWKWND